jgi:sugar lactone lactonase YvrE
MTGPTTRAADHDDGADGQRQSAGTRSPGAQPCSPFAGIHSEGTRWDAAREELLWVDILAGRVHMARIGADGLLGPVRTVDVGRHAGAVAPAAEGGHIVAATTGFLHVDDAGAVRELVQPEAGRADVRMNDAICDPQGRFWAGTMAYDEAPGAGRLYRLGLDGACALVLEGLTISNGMGWSPDGGTMYLADSGVGDVYAFDFDAGTGDLSHQRTLVHVTQPGVPDGLTVDDEGNLWVALWDGGAVACFDAEGALRATVQVPVARPTSCAFGGNDGATLFVSTSREGLGPTALERQPLAGHVLRVDGLGVTGPPCTPYRGPTSAP